MRRGLMGRQAPGMPKLVGIVLALVVAGGLVATLSQQPQCMRLPQMHEPDLALDQQRASFPGAGRTAVPPKIDQAKLAYHGCVAIEQVCIDQGRFIVFSPVKQPGHKDYVEHLFDPGLTWLNTPGQPEHFVGTKMGIPWPHMRSNSTADQPDIATPAFSPNVVPLIWYPVHAEDFMEAVLQSVLPLHAMQLDGAIARNISFVPMMNGFVMPSFLPALLAPFSNNPIETLEDLSSREHIFSPTRSRCFQRLLLCKVFSMFNHRDEGEGKARWDQALQPAVTGQQVVEHYRPQLKVPRQSAHTLKVAIVQTRGAKRILNLDEVVSTCAAWRPADAEKRLQCFAWDFATRVREASFVELLQEVQSFDILLGMHGAALASSLFMRPNTSLVELRPCDVDAAWLDNYFQRTLRSANRTLAFTLATQSRELCFPGDLELRGDRTGLDPDQLELVFKREQDLHVKPAALEAMLALVVDKVGGTPEAYQQRLQQDPVGGSTVVQ